MTSEQDYESSPELDYVASPFGMTEKSLSSFDEPYHAPQHPIIPNNGNNMNDMNDMNNVSKINNDDVTLNIMETKVLNSQSPKKKIWECSSCTYHNPL